MSRFVTLRSGQRFPLMGLGTFEARDDVCIEVVKDAIDVGYRHIDTAAVYENEKAVGIGIQAKIQDGTITREDIFVTSKLWCTHTRQDLVIPALKKTLADLNLKYLDLYLIHWPFSFKEETGTFIPLGQDGKVVSADRDYVDTWKEMEKCLNLGLTKNIGVSNFTIKQLTRLLQNSTIKPVTNQIECHPFLNQKPLIAFCKERDIVVTAYSPLANPGKQIAEGKPKLIDHPVLVEIGATYKKSPAQVTLRYLIDLGVNPIPKSASKSRLEENLNVFDFKISEEDRKRIDALNSNTRTCPWERATNAPYYPFADDA